MYGPNFIVMPYVLANSTNEFKSQSYQNTGSKMYMDWFACLMGLFHIGNGNSRLLRAYSSLC